MFNIALSDFKKYSNEVLSFTNVETENGNVQKEWCNIFNVRGSHDSANKQPT